MNEHFRKSLKIIPKALQEEVLSALDVLRDAGDDGLTAEQWLAGILPINRSFTSEIVMAAALNVGAVGRQKDTLNYVSLFSIRRVEEWELRYLINVASAGVSCMRDMPSFTAKSLAAAIHAETGISNMDSMNTAQTIIESFHGTLCVDGDSFSYPKDNILTRDDNMKFFREAASQ